MWENCKQTKITWFYIVIPWKISKNLAWHEKVLRNICISWEHKGTSKYLAINNIYKHHGIDFPIILLFLHKRKLRLYLILLPPSVKSTKMIDKCKPCIEAVVSGWMAVRGNRRRETGCKGFVLSDHADWTELNRLVD